MSTFWLIFWLDETIFNNNTISGILSYERESLRYLWDIVRVAYDNLPEDVRFPHSKYNESELAFAYQNSKIFVSLSIRSTAVHNLHISEVCHMDANSIKASLATVPPDGNVTIESTANGIGNEGHLLYEDAKAGLNGYQAHFFPWFIQEEYRVPLSSMAIARSKEEDKLIGYAKKNFGVHLSDEQILWRRIQKKELSYLYDQEFPEDENKAFLSTGNPYFDNKKIITLLNEARDYNRTNGIFEENYDYVAYEKPDSRDVYVAGVDVAEGIDGDYSVIKILNISQRREAFKYRARVPVDKFYKECDRFGRLYNNALMAVERNNHGHAVIQGLFEICKYPNLYVQDKDIRVVKVRGIQEPKTIVKIGWETTSLSKPLMLDQLKEGLEGNAVEDIDTFQPEILFRDEIFLQECLTLQQSDNKIGATSGKNDDDVMGTAIAFQMYLRARKKLTRKVDDGILVGQPLEYVKNFGII